MSSINPFQRFMATTDDLINSLSDSKQVQKSENPLLNQLPENLLTSQKEASSPLEERVAIVLRSSDTFKNIDLSKIPSPIGKKIAEALETSQKQAIEEFQDLLHEDDNQVKVQKWLQDNGPLFTKNLLKEMSKDQVLQFTALLAAFKPMIPEDEVSRLRQNLPDYAQTYLEIIDSHIENKILPESARSRILSLFPENTDRNLFLAAMAHLINVEKIPVKEIFYHNLLNQQDFLDMAPSLRYVDLRGLNVNSTNDFQENLIKSCFNANFLFITNHIIKALPPLPHCKELNCSKCPSPTFLVR